MKILIEIDCDTARELQNHLTHLHAQVSEEIRRKQIPVDGDFEVGYVFKDDNCYGSHYAIVKE